MGLLYSRRKKEGKKKKHTHQKLGFPAAMHKAKYLFLYSISFLEMSYKREKEKFFQ